MSLCTTSNPTWGSDCSSATIKLMFCPRIPPCLLIISRATLAPMSCGCPSLYPAPVSAATNPMGIPAPLIETELLDEVDEGVVVDVEVLLDDGKELLVAVVEVGRVWVAVEIEVRVVVSVVVTTFGG